LLPCSCFYLSRTGRRSRRLSSSSSLYWTQTSGLGCSILDFSGLFIIIMWLSDKSDYVIKLLCGYGGAIPSMWPSTIFKVLMGIDNFFYGV